MFPNKSLYPPRSYLDKFPLSLSLFKNGDTTFVHNAIGNYGPLHRLVEGDGVCLRIGLVLPIAAPVPVVNYRLPVEKVHTLFTLALRRRWINYVVVHVDDVIRLQKFIQQIFVTTCQINDFLSSEGDGRTSRQPVSAVRPVPECGA